MKAFLLSITLFTISIFSRAQMPAPFPVTAGGGVNCAGPVEHRDGLAATGLGCGGGSASWYGGKGGDGLYGGGGGGAAGYDGLTSPAGNEPHPGGNGGNGVVVVAFRNSSNGVIGVYLYSSGSSFTAPAGTATAKIWAIGAGGGGSGVPGGNDAHSGGGGGAGGTAYKSFTITAGQTVTYTLGTGGAGGATTSGAAGTATTVVFGSAFTLTANGGNGGTFNAGAGISGDAAGGGFSGGDGGADGGNGGGVSGDTHGGSGGGIGGTATNTASPSCGAGRSGTNSSDVGGLFIAASGTLPLKLISFSGSKQSNDAVLQWQTADEVNVSHFELQRSDDGQDFSAIAIVFSGATNYSFKDANIFSSKSTVYYRLKSIDNDGQFTYSSIIKLSAQQLVTLSVFPNPAKNVLTISGLKQKGTIRLYSVEGKLMQQQNITTQSTTIDISAFANGIYLLQYQQEGQMATQKIIKQ